MIAPSPLGSCDRQVIEFIQGGAISMTFQPIREVGTAKRFGFEALLRGPEGTPLSSPAALFAKDSLLSPPVLHFLDRACLEAALRGGRIFPGHLKLFINIHGETLCMSGSRGWDLMALIDSVGIAPERVVLEISETTDVPHVKGISRLLASYRRRGLQVALDDIGVRYPWLYHLLYLEPDYIKVDRAFVRHLGRHPRKGTVLSGLRDLAEKAGAQLIAEGIETRDDWKSLAEIGVPYGQGYWLGTPRAAGYWCDASGSEKALAAGMRGGTGALGPAPLEPLCVKMTGSPEEGVRDERPS